MTGPRPRWARAGALLLAALAGSAGCRRPPPLPPPDVLLLTVDTLRPDALGWIGGGDATPELDRLAAEGFRFPAALTPVPLTLPAHASLLTGLWPRRHGVRDNGQVLGPAPATLAELLRRRGYATAAFVSGYPLQAQFGLDRGFDRYDDRVTRGEGAWLERPADATNAAALAWVATAPRPAFLWVHYYEPHFPYEPAPRLVRPGRRGAYDGEVAAVDAAFGELRRGLERRGAGWLTVFAADHGESLGEHGEGTHGFFVYDSTVRVPLVVHRPGRIAAGTSGAAARLVDVAPTVLDLLAIAPPAELDGVSLRPILEERAPAPPPPAYLETVQPWTSYGWAPLRAVVADGWKLIAAPRPELYDLGRDPGETADRLAGEGRRARDLERHLAAIEARPAVGDPGAAADPEAARRLAALGYLGAGRPAAEPPPGLPDPKDRIARREALTVADDLLRRGEAAAAARRFAALLAEEPGNRFAASRLGVALLAADDVAAAAAALERAVDLDPDEPETRGAYAEALGRAGRHADAATQWAEVARRRPREARAWANLGAELGLSGRIPEAVAALERAVELAPGDPDRLARLAFAQHAAGRLAAAAGHLEEAAALAGPERFPYAGALGLILARLERSEEALVWLRRSRPQEADFAAARLELARRELRRGDRPAAERALEEALAADPRLAAAVRRDPDLGPLAR